jgi:hypothetical protein
MTGIWLVAGAIGFALAALIIYLVRAGGVRAALTDWGLWLILAVIVIGIALEWGNIAVIYSYAGWSG